MDGSRVFKASEEFFKARDCLLRMYVPVQDPCPEAGTVGYKDGLEHLVSEFTKKSRKAGILDPYLDDVWVFTFFYYKSEKEAEKTKRRPLCAHYKIIDHALHMSRVIHDQVLVQCHDWSRVLNHHENAVQVTIMKFQPEKNDDALWEKIKSYEDTH